MKQLYDEVLRRFPEVMPHVMEGDEDLPYMVVGYVAEWLLTVARPAISSEVVERVVDFHRWCTSQPQGRTAADDVTTIEVVSLIEKLFEHDELLPLIPQLLSKEELLTNQKYLVSWVGADRFQAALRLAGRERKGRRRV